jgi:hypothetical protein
MFCSYCGVEAKTPSTRFCHACRKAFWDLCSPGELPPVSAPVSTAATNSAHKTGRGNNVLLTCTAVGLVGFASALFLPAVKDSPGSAQAYLVIDSALVLLSALMAWSYTRWSIIVSLGVGFAATIFLNIGQSALQTYQEPAHQASAGHNRSGDAKADQRAGASAQHDAWISPAHPSLPAANKPALGPS